MQYISSHIRSHTPSLKIQPSKNNNLTLVNCSQFTEEANFDGSNTEKNIDTQLTYLAG